jgi:hypothetical protein
MTDQPSGDSLRDLLFQRMQEKETEELIAIWREHDQSTWTAEAFEIVEKILIQRLGQLPEPDTSDDETDEDDEEETVVEYPTDKRLIWIAELSGRLSWILLIVAVIYAGLGLIHYFTYQLPPSDWVRNGLGTFLLLAAIEVLSRLSGVLAAGFFFLVLQAFMEIIYLMMDIRDFVQPDPAKADA